MRLPTYVPRLLLILCFTAAQVLPAAEVDTETEAPETAAAADVVDDADNEEEWGEECGHGVEGKAEVAHGAVYEEAGDNDDGHWEEDAANVVFSQAGGGADGEEGVEEEEEEDGESICASPLD